MLVTGGCLAAAAAFLAGACGFGFGLTATPLLLLAGFSLPVVVTVNLLISLATRLSVAWRLRAAIVWRRVAALVGGAAPGLWVGSVTLGAFNGHDLKVMAATVVAAAVLAIAWADRHPPQPRLRGLNVAAGFVGGVLGTSTSLTGVPPALLFARRRVAQAGFFADLSVYFIATSALAIGVLAVSGHLARAGVHAFAWWLPGVLVANVAGTSVGLRLAPSIFRSLTLAFAFVAAIVTAVSA